MDAGFFFFSGFVGLVLESDSSSASLLFRTTVIKGEILIKKTVSQVRFSVTSSNTVMEWSLKALLSMDQQNSVI